MFSILSILLTSFFNVVPTSDTTQYQLFIGSYTSQGNPGIEVYQINGTQPACLMYSLKNTNASFYAFNTDQSFLYAASEDMDSKALVNAYQKNKQGKFELVNAASSLGSAPCYVAFRNKSKTVYSANYVGGSMSVFKTAQGKLLPASQLIQYKGASIHPERQQGAHAHMIAIAPDESYLLVTDLGSDKIYQHTILEDGLVNENYIPIAITPGNGPRHIIFNPKGNRAYLINELSGMVDVFEVQNKKFTKIQTIASDTTTLSKTKGSADIHLAPDGKWLISSNRITSNDLAIFKVDAKGLLTPAGHQTVATKPRNFTFDPSGNFIYVASQDDNKVQIFSFNNSTGKMTNTNNDIKVMSPVCLKFIPRYPR
jgi:6-phosphogluconolactonase (cycloisomerase 2 family)